jgi:hypothetical protein
VKRILLLIIALTTPLANSAVLSISNLSFSSGGGYMYDLLGNPIINAAEGTNHTGLFFKSNVNLISDYVSRESGGFATSNWGGITFTHFTAESVDGVVGGPVTSGLIDTDTGIITIDFSANFIGSNVILGSGLNFDYTGTGTGVQETSDFASGVWDANTGFFSVTWITEKEGLCAGQYNGCRNEAYATGYAEVSQVPIPAAAWLFGSALLGLAGIKRRK